MNELLTGEKTDSRRLVEAAAWRTHLTEMEVTSTPAFESWLTNDARNAAAWSRVQNSWDLLGEHATAPELLELRRKALGEARDAGRRRWRKGGFSQHSRAAIAAGIAVLTIAAMLIWTLTGPDVYRTAVGERRSVTLADGSHVELDALTEVRVDYSERARILKLVKGQAKFDVAHDVQRPFSVLAAGRKVVATGTTFNMNLLGSDLWVTLIEGQVVVLPQDSAAASGDALAASGDAGREHIDRDEDARTISAVHRRPAVELAPSHLENTSIELTAGQQLKISHTGAAHLDDANVQHATSWQSGKLIFEDEPLLSVIVRMNRYTTRPLRVADEKVAALRISGVFNARDTDGFIGTITHYLPVNADYSDSEIVLLSFN